MKWHCSVYMARNICSHGDSNQYGCVFYDGLELALHCSDNMKSQREMKIDGQECLRPVCDDTLPFKRNATLGLGAFLTPIWGKAPHVVKKLLTGVVSPILSHKLSKLPVLTTFCHYEVVDPKLGSFELLNQAMCFFWIGVKLCIYTPECKIYICRQIISEPA